MFKKFLHNYVALTFNFYMNPKITLFQPYEINEIRNFYSRNEIISELICPLSLGSFRKISWHKKTSKWRKSTFELDINYQILFRHWLFFPETKTENHRSAGFDSTPHRFQRKRSNFIQFSKNQFFCCRKTVFHYQIKKKNECLVERRLIKYTFVGVYLTTEYVEIQYIGMIEAGVPISGIKTELKPIKCLFLEKLLS